MSEKMTEQELAQVKKRYGVDQMSKNSAETFLNALLSNIEIVKQRKTRTVTFTKNDVRSYSFKVMNVIANLSPSERKRVLTECLRLNEK